jgi:hypothetical protein
MVIKYIPKEKREGPIMHGNSEKTSEHIFSGNIYIFQAFDIGDDINLEQVRDRSGLTQRPLTLSKYFKNYHIPLAVELPQAQVSLSCSSVKIHNFGAVSITYKIPFNSTLQSVRKNLDALDNQFQEQSINDISAIFKKIKPFITRSTFFHTRSSYVLIQVDPNEHYFSDTVQLKEAYGNIIGSMLRFETESLSEVQVEEIIASAMGYYRGDLIVIDTSAAFVYDSEYTELLEFFEFANVQHLELRYFDRVLDQQLNAMYEGKVRKLSVKAYIPFIGTLSRGPVDDLGKLRVDISVITERLEGSIKLVGEPYYSELYELLKDKLDLKNWKDGIDRKLNIIQDIRSVFQHKVDSAREDLLSVLITILILIELIIGMLSYLKH